MAASRDFLVRSIILSPTLSETARSREFLSAIASAAGFPEDRVFDIKLASSEAIANAIEHSPVKGEIRVRALLHSDRLEVEIQGPGEFQTPDRLKERSGRGLGLPLMAKLCDHLAMYSNPIAGTLVTLTFYLPNARREQGDEPLPPSIRELIESSELIFAVTEAAPVGMYVLGPDLRFRWANQAWRNFLNPSHRSVDLTGLHYAEVVPEAESAGLLDILQAISEEGKAYAAEEFEFRGFERGVTYWRWEALPLKRGREGPPYDVVALVSDVTERRRAEQELRESEERYRALFDSMDQGFCIIEVLFDEEDRPFDYRILEANPAYCSQTGRTHPVGRRGREMAPNLEEFWFDTYGRVAKTREPTRFTHRAAPLNRDLEVYAFAVGRPEQRRVAVLFRDVTDLVRHEDLARALETKFRTVADWTFDWEFWLAPDGSVLYCSPACQRMAGHAAEEFIADPGLLVATVHPDDRPRMAAHYGSVTSCSPDGINYRLVTPEGEIRRIAHVCQSVFGPDGEWLGRRGTNRDVTEQNKVAEELRDSEERFRALVEGFAQAVWEADAAGAIVKDSPTWRAHTGQTLEEWLRGGWVEAVHPDDREAAERRWREAIAAKRNVNSEVRLRDASGGYRWTNVRAVPLQGPTGELRKWVGMNIDIDAGKRAEEALRESEARSRVLAEENDRLYRQQLDIAETLQVALLNIPSEMGPLRIGHLYRSATEAAKVGGDFYDVFEAKDQKVVMLIGDVSGHGIQAARTATLVKDVIHAFIHQSIRPHEVLKRANALLVEKELPGFVTLFLGILDPDTGTLRYASAGHPETLLRRGGSGEIQLLGSGSLPLGVDPNASWKPGTLELEPGDFLVLYTDGVLEARRNGEFFGRKRLESLLKRKRLAVERLPHLILDQVLAFSEGKLSDDVAILAVSVTKRPETGPAPFAQERLLR